MRTRRGLIGPDEQTSIRRQCELLGVSRSSVYYDPVEPDAEELELMRRIDELHLEFPFYGSRSIARALRNKGCQVNRKRVQRLMRLMGLESVAPKPNTSKPNEEHPVYPYLLRGVTIDRPNQVGAADVTYIPLARGFAYLVAIMDWASRRVLSWRLSNTMDALFCVEALQEALSRFGRPDIFNSDQGYQFTAKGLHRRPRRGGREDQHGRQGPLHRQCLRRAALALAQVRRRLPEGLHRPDRGEGRNRRVLPVLQHPPLTPGARLSDAGRLLRRPLGEGGVIQGRGPAKRMNSRAGNGAVEADAAMDERNEPLAHSGLENAARFPQLPQPASAGLSTYNPSRPHLSRAPFWSEEWGPPQCASVRQTLEG